MAITDTGSMTSGAMPGTLSGFATAGNIFAAAGLATQAIGAYYATKSGKYQARAAALDLEFEQTMSALNARAAEQDAQLELQAGHREMGRMGLQYRQAIAAMRASTGASGVDIGVGSSAEALASANISKELDLITINSNAVRAANAARTRSVNYRNQAAFAGLGAQNLRSASSLMSPLLSGATSLLGGAGQVGAQWAQSEREAHRYRRL